MYIYHNSVHILYIYFYKTSCFFKNNFIECLAEFISWIKCQLCHFLVGIISISRLAGTCSSTLSSHFILYWAFPCSAGSGRLSQTPLPAGFLELRFYQQKALQKICKGKGAPSHSTCSSREWKVLGLRQLWVVTRAGRMLCPTIVILSGPWADVTELGHIFLHFLSFGRHQHFLIFCINNGIGVGPLDFALSALPIVLYDLIPRIKTIAAWNV